MADQQPQEAGDNPSAKPDAISKELASMMADLGDGRLEELATDGGGVGRNQDFSRDVRGHNRRPVTQREDQPMSELAKRFRAAIDRGDFHDDDYNSVKNLDPLDGGNAHRINKPPSGLGRGAGRGAGQSRNSYSNDPGNAKYDPM
ncbi:hypothetical protein F4779DRAFT_567529 [Xylariaceae sp. FL0662B]|nr:hypothetical protein F4779DRAFT_567529 [Xylariaceae sp. FL0662B]